MGNNWKSRGEGPLPGCNRAMKRILWVLRCGFGCLLILLGCAGPVFASNPNQLISQMAHKSWGAKEGLVDVLAVTQTRDGYLWVATAEGLFRFDGIGFTLWKPVAETTAADSPVTVLCPSRDGSLWMGSKSGLSCMRNGALVRFAATNGLPEGEVTSMLEDRSGAIWVATTTGLSKFQNGRWILFGTPNGLAEGRTRIELEDRNGNLWVAVDDPEIAGGTLLGCLRSGQSRFELAGEHLGTVAMLREAPDGLLWVAETSQSVRPFLPKPDNAAGLIRPFAVPSKAILFDRDGLFWIGAAGQGLFRTDYAKLGDVRREEPGLPADRFDEKQGLSSDFITCAYEDREGNVWFGSAGGLDRFRNNRVVSWSVTEGLSYDQRLAIAAGADGSLWTGSEQGLQRILGSKVETLGFDWIGPEWGNGIYSLYATASGDVWVGALNGVGHIKGEEHAPVAIAGGMELRNVTAITQDHDGGLWLCDQLRGISRLAHGKVRIFASSPQLSSQVVNAAITDRSGAVWLGFQDGSISCHQDGQFHAYAVPQSVLALLCDHTGRVWAAGLGGVSRFQRDHFETLKSNGDFPNSELTALVEDNEGFFWIASRTGLVRVNPKELDQAFADPSHEIAHDVFGTGDGLRGFPRHSRPFPTAAKSRDGRIWFATTAGLAMIDPQRLQKSTAFPPVHIVQVAAGGAKLGPVSNWMLPAGTKDIKIDYTAPSFYDPERIQFRCKLEGYDAQWREAGTARQISYSGLGPRSYEFRVLACNYDGVWGDVGDTWTFSIRPAFYQTSWFLVASILAGALVVWGLSRWNLARATAQTEARMNARMEAQMDERKRIAQELHDTILQGFTGIRLKLWAVTQRLVESPVAAGEQLKQVIQQADQCLTEARRSVWALRSPRLDEMDLPAALSARIHDLVLGTQLQWSFKSFGTPHRLSNIVEYNLLRIGEEAVTNVIKHAGAKAANLELHFNRRQVVLKVSDDGRGFDPDHPAVTANKHFGLAGMKERAGIIGGILVIQSQPGGPTTLTVTVG